jgi:hypothetical protein
MMDAPKSTSCEIVAFNVDGVQWTINGTNITHTYPAGTTASTLTPYKSLDWADDRIYSY